MSRPLRLTLTAAPAQMPVSLAELKLAARIEEDAIDDDALLAGFIRSASEEFERFTGLAGISRTYTMFLDFWPREPGGGEIWEGWREGPQTLIGGAPRALDLPRPPLQSVGHVKTYDDSDAATTFAASNYFVDTVSMPGRIVLRRGVAAPDPDRVANGIEIQFVAGYGDDPADVPEAARDGIARLAVYLNEHRGDCQMGEAVKDSGAGALWSSLIVRRL